MATELYLTYLTIEHCVGGRLFEAFVRCAQASPPEAELMDEGGMLLTANAIA